MKTKSTKLLFALLISATLFTACKKQQLASPVINNVTNIISKSQSDSIVINHSDWKVVPPGIDVNYYYSYVIPNYSASSQLQIYELIDGDKINIDSNDANLIPLSYSVDGNKISFWITPDTYNNYASYNYFLIINLIE